MGQEDAQTEKSKPCHCSLLKHSSFQEGLLDIEVEFSDGTTTPLKAIDPAHYYLTVDSLNPHVIAFAPVAGSTDPRVIAVGRGQGKGRDQLKKKCFLSGIAQITSLFVYLGLTHQHIAWICLFRCLPLCLFVN